MLMRGYWGVLEVAELVEAICLRYSEALWVIGRDCRYGLHIENNMYNPAYVDTRVAISLTLLIPRSC